MPSSVQQSFEFAFKITLHVVQKAPYKSLAIEDKVFPFWIASHVLSGSVVTETAGVRQTAKAGDVMVHPPHLPFAEHASSPGVHQWMAFDASSGPASSDGLVSGWDLLTRVPVALVVSLNTDERRARYEAAFSLLESAQEQTAPQRSRALAGRELQVVALTASLLSELIDAWESSGAPLRPAAAQSARDRFARLIAYMERNLHRRITRDDLAAQVCLHPASLDRAFRAACGVPPLRLLLDMRLQRARQLLRSTDDTLETIARGCGLGDAARLSRTFRAAVGESPGAWRSQARRLNSTTTGYIPLLSPSDEESYNADGDSAALL